MDPNTSKRNEAKNKSKKTLGKLGLDLTALDLSEHEEIIAGEVVHADEINVMFKGALGRRSEAFWSRKQGTLADSHALQTSAGSIPSSPSCARPSSSPSATPSSSTRPPACSEHRKESCCTAHRGAGRRCSLRCMARVIAGTGRGRALTRLPVTIRAGAGEGVRGYVH